MTINKKTIIYIVAAVVVIAAVSGGTILVLGAINKKDASNSKSTQAESSIDNLRKQAEKAREADDTEKAKELLQQASEELNTQPKSEENTNAQVDVAAQQCMLGVKSACKGY